MKKLLLCLIPFILILSACSPTQGTIPPQGAPDESSVDYVDEYYEAYVPLEEQPAEQLLPAVVEDEPEQEPELAPAPEQQTPSTGEAQPPVAGGSAAAQSSTTPANDLSVLFSTYLRIDVFVTGPGGLSLPTESAQNFYSGLNFSQLTPVEGIFEGIAFNFWDTVDTMAEGFVPRLGIRLMGGRSYYLDNPMHHITHRMFLDQEANIAHHIVESVNFDTEEYNRISERFYHMPSGFYDAVLARVMELEQHRAW